MSEKTREHISSLMDGEISRETSRFLVRRLGSDEQLCATWARYHLVRDCLRHQDGSLSGEDLCSRVNRALEDEEPAAPVRRLSLGWLKPVDRLGTTQLTTTRVVEGVIENHDSAETSLADLAKHTGYQQDYLNRLLKAECGLTLGQLRSRHRLETAQKLLANKMPVQQVGERIGILDNNYFARWFKQQTGVSPSHWKNNPKILQRS